MRIGIDLGGTKIEAIALDDHGATLARRRVPTPCGDYPAILDAVGGLVAFLERETGRHGSVGVAAPGAISKQTGVIKNSNSTGLNGKPLDRDLAQRLRREIRLENDANCFALSEAVDGAAADASVVFGVILGTGVGGGLIIDKAAITGRNRIAGEWGHNPLPWPRGNERPGPPCYCGKTGCIGTFLSGPALGREYRPQRPRADAGSDRACRLARRGRGRRVSRALSGSARARPCRRDQRARPREDRARRRPLQYRAALRAASGAGGTLCVLRRHRYADRARPARRFERRSRRRLAVARRLGWRCT